LVSYCDGEFSKYVGRIVDDWHPGGYGLPATLGFLVDDPEDAVYRTPAEWGDRVYVTGVDFIPSIHCRWVDGQPPAPEMCSQYDVQAECVGGVLSEPVLATYIDRYGNEIPGLWDWPDVAPPPDHVVGLDDILVVINAYQGRWTYQESTLIIPNLDLAPANGLVGLCEPDQVIGLHEIMLIIMTIQGGGWDDTHCPDPCDLWSR
jgi:hypothetical protein